MRRVFGLMAVMPLACAQRAQAADAGALAAEKALFDSAKVRAEELRPLALETAIVEGGQPRAVICCADEPAWRQAAETIREAIRQSTGVTLPLQTDTQLEDSDGNVILLGHLDNNREVARLYHNLFVCLDVGYTGRTGYVIRSVHDPWGTGRNYLLVGGSYPEGTAKAAEAFAALVKASAKGGTLKFGRVMELRFDPTDRAEPIQGPMTDADRDAAIKQGRDLLFSPGQGRSGVARLVDYGIRYQRTGDPRALEVYHALMLALLEYYEKDPYITGEGMRRYDQDFRDAWTFTVGILWDLTEESGAFSDDERLAMTNLLIRLAMECQLYQGWDRPQTLEAWRTNEDIVHNHNTFPALGAYFAGNYIKRHYGRPIAEEWLTVAHGIFNGQKHSSKPLEDAASYQWLPIIHTMIYSLAEGDMTFFEEGHAREAARVAMMATDNAGYQAAFGDHEALKSSSCIPETLQMIAWAYQDPEILWGVRRAAVPGRHPLGQTYAVSFEPKPPTGLTGVAVSRLPRKCYDYAARSPQYPTAPNLPWEETFDKLTFRSGLEREGPYLLLDGFGRGTHMHFDANAIIRYAAGGEPLLVDGEYIKNAPKYHSALVILRDGKAELTPAVTGLERAVSLGRTSYSRTYLAKYDGADWTREIVWLNDGRFLVSDEVKALEEGDYTLRCCWRPWGEAALQEGVLTVNHPPMRLTIANGDGAACRLEGLKTVERLPISRLSQQVARRLKAGETYRFVNLVHAEPADRAEAASVKQVGDGLIVVEGPQGAGVIALGAGTQALRGVACTAEMLSLAPDRIVVVGCTKLATDHEVLSASVPVSIELAPAEGSGAIMAEEEAQVALHLPAGAALKVDEAPATVGADGVAQLKASAGRHVLAFTPAEMDFGMAAAIAEARGRPAIVAGQGEQQARPPALARAWEYAGFKAPTGILRVAAVECEQPHSGRYGPVEKLCDGECSGSTTSVMWPAGVTPTVALSLAEEAEVSSVVLREWHMNQSWDIATRTLELSSDGFGQDVRAVEAPFKEAGTQSWGGNVNTLMEVQVGQKARQLRLTIAPAREDSSVYLAEVEVHGVTPGAAPAIRDMATGDLDGDGREEIVVCSDAGEVAALKEDGKLLWTYTAGERAAMNSVACADVNGDGRAEVVVGGDAERLLLLSADGKELWQQKPPRFRGIESDVMTVLPADVDGDGKPEVICGCKSWQYFAYDGDGTLLWQNVIYAHSATVGWADDFDGDGRAEVIGGNAYYSLNIIDDDGKRLFGGGRLGPEQTAISSSDVDADGRPEILVGTDLGELLCFDGDGQTLWSASVGDKVTRIVAADLTGDGVAEIICSAESAHVFAFRADGSLLWRRALPDGASDVRVVTGGKGPIILAAAGSAGAVALDAQGEVIGAAKTKASAQRVVAVGGQGVVTTAAGTVEAFGLPGE